MKLKSLIKITVMFFLFIPIAAFAQSESGGIAGGVSDSEGVGIQNVEINVYDTDDNWISSSSTNPDGNYTIGAIPTGNYKIQFWSSHLGYSNEWYNDKKDFNTADFVSVTAPDIQTGIDAVLAQGGQIAGRVTDSQDKGIQNVWVWVYDTTSNLISYAYSDANGTYIIGGIPTGTFKVLFWSCSTGHMSEWYNNKVNLYSADTVSVTAPDITTGIDAVLATGGCDNDGDDTDDVWDNCPGTSNPGQEDADGDGIGDACDICPKDPRNDIDSDGICGDVDNCPEMANAGQEDADGEGIGDACDICPKDPRNDIDSDGICGDVDNCPEMANAGQEDGDGDGIGDACETLNDVDGDGIPDEDDNCPESNLEPTIIIDGCYTGVSNKLFDSGCTMSDLVNECLNSTSNHGSVVSCVNNLTNSWKKNGIITGKEFGSIQKCAAK